MMRLVCCLTILAFIGNLHGNTIYDMNDPKDLLKALMSFRKSYGKGEVEKKNLITTATFATLQANAYKEAQKFHAPVNYHCNSNVETLESAIGLLSKTECLQVISVCKLFLKLQEKRAEAFVTRSYCFGVSCISCLLPLAAFCWPISLLGCSIADDYIKSWNKNFRQPFLDLKKMVEQEVSAKNDVEKKNETKEDKDKTIK